MCSGFREMCQKGDGERIFSVFMEMVWESQLTDFGVVIKSLYYNSNLCFISNITYNQLRYINKEGKGRRNVGTLMDT